MSMRYCDDLLLNPIDLKDRVVMVDVENLLTAEEVIGLMRNFYGGSMLKGRLCTNNSNERVMWLL